MEEHGMPVTQSYGEIEEIIDELEKTFLGLKKFGKVHSPPTDHHYFMHNKSTKRSNSESSLIDKIMREWEILGLYLTNSSIYTRVYETRPDLMRAMVTGPPGTPYYHALFCFDIYFTSNYPDQPPELFYHSYGYDLNSNLKRNGKVNLPKLCNMGHSNFKGKSYPNPFRIWDVLATIQHSILKGNPFLDESSSGMTSRKQCSKDVLMRTWEAMLCMLKSPPGDFEVFVKGHFRTRADQILKNYKRHMGSDETMCKLFFKLIRAFEAIGTYCKHHYDQHSYDLALREEAKCSIRKRI